MGSSNLLRLAQDLEWLGCELEFQGMKHANEGFPGMGPTWQNFTRMQKGVLVTIDKLERELKTSVTYNPTPLVGVQYPLEDALEAISVQLAALEDIRHCAAYAVHELPEKVRNFTRMVDGYVKALGRQPAEKRPTKSR